MGIETKYEYIYYTVVNIRGWMDLDSLTWDAAIVFIEDKFKENTDESVNKFRVDSGRYCDDLDFWIRAQNRHKVRPIFVQFEDNQPIKKTGYGQLFELYEEDDEDDIDSRVSVEIDMTVPDYNYGSDDGLAGAGGRL